MDREPRVEESKRVNKRSEVCAKNKTNKGKDKETVCSCKGGNLKMVCTVSSE